MTDRYTHECRLEIRAQKEPWLRGTVSLYIFQRGIANYAAVAGPLKFCEVDAENPCAPAEPALRLQPAEAQQLMDELWTAGIRPAEGAGSAGQMAATEKHLEDMRRLVFDKPCRPLEPCR